MATYVIAEVWTKGEATRIAADGKALGRNYKIKKKKYPMGAYSYIVYKNVDR